MRAIICDRCKKILEDTEPVGRIYVGVRPDVDIEDDLQDWDLCQECMDEIINTIRTKPENLVQDKPKLAEDKSKIVKNKSKTSSSADSKRKPVDIGKIIALKNAGWKAKDIADEMGFDDPQRVSNIIYRHKMKEKSEAEVEKTN